MSKAVEPGAGLCFVELSHHREHGILIDADICMERAGSQAIHGMLSQRITTIMYVSTHLNARRS